ncbi:hypothetical protein [Butyricimonas sp. Marseille-P3923]|uniref:hypothetical protein n=1 Tax=Butyricimonas sp. Marseille-P3923 TaxID=1987504 RepID=UPI000C0710DF|nr:hypothetical protein [Butyricimonas sp. Marseille-P3923]
MKRFKNIKMKRPNIETGTTPSNSPLHRGRGTTRGTTKRFHFQFSTFNFALLLALALIACTSEKIIDDNGIDLREGEQFVSIRLDGMGNTAVPVGRAGDDAPATPAENAIEELTIYSFVGINPEGGTYDPAAAENGRLYTFDFTLERVYRYKAGSDNNDMLPSADGNGYSVAIPVQKDSYYRRFYIKANAGDAPASAVAVPIYQTGTPSFADRTNATVDRCNEMSHTHSNLLTNTDKLILPTTDQADAIRPPLPASGIAFWKEELTGGYFKEHDIFSANDLAKGLTVTLSRRVARFDISNPAATGFTITGIHAANVDYKNCFLFGGSISEGDRTYLYKHPLANATFIPAALYLPYGYYSSSNPLFIFINGTFHGVDIELTATTEWINANTRYVINIINSGTNVSANITLADWTDSNSNIDSDDLYGRLNPEANISIPRKGYDSYISKKDNVITILYDATSYANPFPGINISGAAYDTHPVGIIIPDDVKWLVTDKASENTTGGSYAVTVTAVAENPERESEAYSTSKKYDKATPPYTPPRETTLTLVTNADGKNIHHEYRVVQDWIFPNVFTLSTQLARGTFAVPAGCTFDQSTRTITLPPFQKGYLYYTGDPVAGILKDQSWLHPQRENLRVNLNADDNFQSSSPRSVTLTIRVWDDATSGIITEDYTITQSAGNFAPALLTTGVTVNSTTLSGITVTDDAVMIPDNYNSGTTNPSYADALLLVGKDEKGFIATVPPEQDWLWLEVPLYETMQYYPAHDGKYVRRIRMDTNTGGAERSANINILYRDAGGNIARKTIRVTQGAGGGTI